MTLPPSDLVVLAGGAGRRLDGADKAELVVGGRRLLDVVLAAGEGCRRRVVVGPPRPTDVPVRWGREEPVGGGPVAALAAGLALVDAPVVVVLAVDLPWVRAADVLALRRAMTGLDGAVAVDALGWDQPLLAAYDVAALRAVVSALATPVGASARSVVADLRLARVGLGDAVLDCDTWADVRAAEERQPGREGMR